MTAINPVRAYGYVRVSTSQQAQSGLGLQDQIESIQRYCQLNGFHLVRTYEDAEQSGSIDLHKRPAGKALCQTLQPGDVVVIKRLCRAFRNTLDAIKTATTWYEVSHVTLHIIDYFGQEVNYANPFGAFVFQLMASTMQFERSMIAQRTRDALAIARANGGGISCAPLGSIWVPCNITGAKLERCEEMWRRMKIVHDLREEGWSSWKIMNYALRNGLHQIVSRKKKKYRGQKHWVYTITTRERDWCPRSIPKAVKLVKEAMRAEEEST